jgi:hypothetical protein
VTGVECGVSFDAMTVDGEAIRLWSRHQLLALVISAASCFAVFAQQIQPPRLARNQGNLH